MKHALAVLTVLGTALFTPAVLLAADEAQPNTLTPKEISDGWILLFDGQTPFGWATEGDVKTVEAEALPAARDGSLVVGGKKAVTSQTTSDFCCFELSFQYLGGKGTALVLNGQKYDLPATKGDKWSQVQIRSELHDGQRALQATFTPAGKKPGKPKQLAATGEPAQTAIGFSIPAGAQLQLRDVKLKPLAMKSLFNGKDLTGWKEIPGHQSKFSVTDKGELNIKNGGGDIQTEGQWADLILQLDVISNGKNLNSGVFFRALPGQYWQGYEAQIRNEWDGYSKDAGRNAKKEDRSKPVDCGTGGIYSHQDSRKVVSSDHEWFTYTVLANGNHIALWVNGYQTADWFDNGKDSDSARKGRFLGKGTVSLQGHDPTTDLSFRNIRIQELPPKRIEK